MLALVAGGVLVVLVSKLGGSLPKLPEDPVQLLDVGYIGDLRSYKSSYGSGYTVETATSWFGFIIQLPVIVFRFLFSPTPFDAIRGSSPIADGVKMIDSFLFLGMMVAAWRALRRPLDTKTARQTRLAITALFVLLVVVFAIGTSNVGIAVRHRAKFAWLLLVVIGVWRHSRAPATATVEPVRRPLPAAVSV